MSNHYEGREGGKTPQPLKKTHFFHKKEKIVGKN